MTLCTQYDVLSRLTVCYSVRSIGFEAGSGRMGRGGKTGGAQGRMYAMYGRRMKEG